MWLACYWRSNRPTTNTGLQLLVAFSITYFSLLSTSPIFPTLRETAGVPGKNPRLGVWRLDFGHVKYMPCDPRQLLHHSGLSFLVFIIRIKMLIPQGCNSQARWCVLCPRGSVWAVVSELGWNFLVVVLGFWSWWCSSLYTKPLYHFLHNFQPPLLENSILSMTLFKNQCPIFQLLRINFDTNQYFLHTINTQ